MKKFWLVPVSLALLAALAEAQLESRGVWLALGSPWPEGQPREFSADDFIGITYTVGGVREGFVYLDTTLRVTNAAGDTFLTSQSSTLLGNCFASPDPEFGGLDAGLALEGRVPPGRYTLTIHVHDCFTADQVTLVRPIIVKPSRFGVRLFDSPGDPEQMATDDDTLLTRRQRFDSFGVAEGMTPGDNTLLTREPIGFKRPARVVGRGLPDWSLPTVSEPAVLATPK